MALETSGREPRLVGQYRLLQRLGEGGMGVVHLGLDPAGRAVAVKVLRPHIAADPDARRRLAREVATLRRVRHPRVAAVIDADVEGEVPFLVTHFVPGKPLDAHVRDHGPLPRGHVARVGSVLADALRAIHAAGVVHRDVKPANVMLLDGDPILIDFGIAHLADESRITHTGLVMGTPGYLSPEIIGGDAVTAATDWWGWGATLAFAATGRPPFGSGPIEVVLDRVRRGASDVDGVDAGLRATLTAALSVDPGRRPSPDVLVAGLAAAPPARPSRASQQVAVPAGPEARTQATPPPREAVTTRTPPPREAATVRTPPPPGAAQASRTPPGSAAAAPPAQEAATAVVPPPVRDGSGPAGTRRFGSPPPPVFRPVSAPSTTPPSTAPPSTAPHSTAPPSSAPPVPPAGVQPAGRPANGFSRPYGSPSSGPPAPATGAAAPPPPSDPTRGVLVGLLVVLAGVAAVAPYGAVWLAWLGMVAARVIDRTSTSLLVRRDQRGGRSSSDHMVALVALPWRLAMAGLASLALIMLPILVGISVSFIVGSAQAGTAGRAIPGDPGPLAAGMLALLLTAWLGPGGGSLRRGTRRAVRVVVPGPRARIVAWSLFTLILISVLSVASAGHGPDWGPLEQSPIVNNLTSG